MGRVIRVVILVQEVISRTARVREQRIQLLLLDLRIARHCARLADERRHLITLDSIDHVRRRRRREWLCLRQRVAELVNLDRVNDVSAAA
jgi:hypothetical protein